MNTKHFVGKILLNGIGSLFYFGFKYVWLMLRCMRSKPLVISQIKAILMVFLPIFIVLRYPIHIIVCLYCLAAMYYGMYKAYQDEMDNELAYHARKSSERYMRIKEASLDNILERTTQENNG